MTYAMTCNGAQTTAHPAMPRTRDHTDRPTVTSARVGPPPSSSRARYWYSGGSRTHGETGVSLPSALYVLGTNSPGLLDTPAPCNDTD